MARQALFVMAKDPRAGQVKTRLCPPLTPEVAARLYRCFLLDVLDLVAGLPGVDPVIAFSPPEAEKEFSRLTSGRFQLIPQEGADLGARLENAFRVLFQQGYTRVAAVSTDTPDLPAKYLQEAFFRLRDARVVLGPCPDGGYYLIGLSSPAPELFRDMPWSTDRVVPETDARAKKMGLALSYLPEWHDVDTATDLDRLVRDLDGGTPSAGRAPRTAAFCQEQFSRRPFPWAKTGCGTTAQDPP
jgi:rSAM/selenodomain-associated transferase 1